MKHAGKLKKYICLTLAVLFLLSAAACAPSVGGKDEAGTDPPSGGLPGGQDTPRGGVTLHRYAGAQVDLCMGGTRAYLDLEDEAAQAQYLFENQTLGQDGQAPEFSWESDGSDSYTVSFADNAAFEDAVVFETQETSLEDIGFFLPGTEYYWKVEGESGVSEIDRFSTQDRPVRIIEADGAYNVRDLGGWQAAEGKTVRYGMIYRGGQLNGYAGMDHLTEEGIRTFSDILGIRSEIDLRTAGRDDGGQTECWWSDSAAYVKAELSAFGYIFPEFREYEPFYREYDEDTAASLRTIFEFLSDEKNYPVYIHCNAGADRTGTLAFLINGLLGVSYEDLTRDFELTSFTYYGRRWRSSVENGEFTDSGVMQNDTSNYVAWDKMVDMMAGYAPGGTLSEAIENYLKTVCGISAETLARVKEIMLE